MPVPRGESGHRRIEGRGLPEPPGLRHHPDDAGQTGGQEAVGWKAAGALVCVAMGVYVRASQQSWKAQPAALRRCFCQQLSQRCVCGGACTAFCAALPLTDCELMPPCLPPGRRGQSDQILDARGLCAPTASLASPSQHGSAGFGLGARVPHGSPGFPC